MAQGKQVNTEYIETDVSTYRRYAVTYYNRSIESKSEETRERNRLKYLKYKKHLEAAGLTVTEGKDSLIIK